MLKQWILQKEKDYAQGVQLYQQYAGSDNFFNYFSQVENPPVNGPHFQMLLKKLIRFNRIGTEPKYKIPVKACVKPINPKEIKVEKLDLTPKNKFVNLGELQKNKKYVNKLLTLKWQDLDTRDKVVFFDDKEYFETKQELLFANAEIERKLKALHASLKQICDAKKKAEILEEANANEKVQVANWKDIDTWEQPVKLDPIEQAKEETKQKILKIGQLKGYIRRANNDLKDPKKKFSNGVRAKKEKKLASWIKELEKLENEIA